MLYTSCPDCRTIFRVTTSALRQAEGQVQCGNCDTIFNAVDALREAPSAADPRSFPPREPEPELPDWAATHPAESGSFVVLDSPDAEETDEGDSHGDEALIDDLEVESIVEEPEEGLVVAEDDESRAQEEAFQDQAPEDLIPVEELILEGLQAEQLLVVDADSGSESDEVLEPGPVEEPEDEAGEALADVLIAADEEAPDAGAEYDLVGIAYEKDDAAADTGEDAREVAVPVSEGSEDEWAAFFERATQAHTERVNDDPEIARIENQLAVAAQLAAEPDAESMDGSEEGDVSDETYEYHAQADSGEGLTAEEIDDTLSAVQEVGATVQERDSSIWIGGAIALAVLLSLQAMHYFRAELAGQPLIGTIVESVYGAFGRPIVPAWDLSQYEILDWNATADTAVDGTETLSISARIRNNGPVDQPYPSIQLELKDRWDQTVGSRIFAPSDYLPQDHDGDALMSAGFVVPATLEVVEGAIGAYGFELDVCLEPAAGAVACMSDAVFE